MCSTQLLGWPCCMKQWWTWVHTLSVPLALALQPPCSWDHTRLSLRSSSSEIFKNLFLLFLFACTYVSVSRCHRISYPLETEAIGSCLTRYGSWELSRVLWKGMILSTEPFLQSLQQVFLPHCTFWKFQANECIYCYSFSFFLSFIYLCYVMFTSCTLIPFISLSLCNQPPSLHSPLPPKIEAKFKRRKGKDKKGENENFHHGSYSVTQRMKQ